MTEPLDKRIEVRVPYSLYQRIIKVYPRSLSHYVRAHIEAMLYNNDKALNRFKVCTMLCKDKKMFELGQFYVAYSEYEDDVSKEKMVSYYILCPDCYNDLMSKTIEQYRQQKVQEEILYIRGIFENGINEILPALAELVIYFPNIFHLGVCSINYKASEKDKLLEYMKAINEQKQKGSSIYKTFTGNAGIRTIT